MRAWRVTLHQPPERVTISEKLMMWGKGGPEAVGYLRHWKHRPLSHDRPPHANGPDGPDEGRLPLLMERFQVRVLCLGPLRSR